MCNFIGDDKKDNNLSNDDWYQPDICSECGLHFCMCECGKNTHKNSNKVDIYGPNYPPC